jgi:hypothetical protein
LIVDGTPEDWTEWLTSTFAAAGMTHALVSFADPFTLPSWPDVEVAGLPGLREQVRLFGEEVLHELGDRIALDRADYRDERSGAGCNDSAACWSEALGGVLGALVRRDARRHPHTRGPAAGPQIPASASDIAGCTLVMAHLRAPASPLTVTRSEVPMDPNAKWWACLACHRKLFGTQE